MPSAWTRSVALAPGQGSGASGSGAPGFGVPGFGVPGFGVPVSRIPVFVVPGRAVALLISGQRISGRWISGLLMAGRSLALHSLAAELWSAQSLAAPSLSALGALGWLASCGLATGLLSLASPPMACAQAMGGDRALSRLLEQRGCPRCQLADVDLVHADLRAVDLRGAQLQRANLGQARLDGARLNGADLTGTSLVGASLRGVDLRGARLEGTDLRQADLSGALLDPGALAHSHWQRASGLDIAQLTYADLHNAGVEAAGIGNFPEAEHWFNEAIRRQPAAAISWVARGISRNELGQSQGAAADFAYAAGLYRLQGEEIEAQALDRAAQQLQTPPAQAQGGNGLGGVMLGGALAALQLLAPLAAKALLPIGL